MKSFFVLGLTAMATGSVFAFERFEPQEDPARHADFKKFTTPKGNGEYDVRYYEDGRFGAYVILPEGETGEIVINGRTYALNSGRTDLGVCVPATARPTYQKPDHVVAQRWEAKKELVRSLQGQTLDLVLVGDSITDYWEDEKRGLPIWKKLSKNRSTLNLGFAGDGSEHTLWRINEGILDGFKAKQIGILIGANGGSWTDVAVARGIKAVLDAVRAKHPESQILLTALVPWGEKRGNYHRAKNNRTNAMIEKYCDGKDVVWFDFGNGLLDRAGTLSKKMAADFVHPTTAGYEIWYRALLPLLAERGKMAITSDGLATAHIQLDHFPSAVEQLAAKEFSSFAKTVSGSGVSWIIEDFTTDHPDSLAETEIVIASEEHARRIAPKAVLEKLAATKNPEAYVYASGKRSDGGNGIRIVGKTDMGALFGTYAFVEDQMGVRFLHPGPAGTILPKKAALAVPDDLFVFREPWVTSRRQSTWFGCVKPLDHEKDVEPFQTRRGYYYRAYWNQRSLPPEKLLRIRMGNSRDAKGGETMLRDAVPMVLFDAHPEYFPLVDGLRSYEAGDFQMRRCLTNPDVREMVFKYAMKQLTYSDGFNIDYRDQSGGWCECEACKKYGTGADGKYTVPNYALRFTQDLQDRIHAVRPDARLQMLIYRDYRDPVSNDLRFDHGMMARYCPHQRCYAHSLTAPCNKKFRDQYDFWNGRCSKIGIFDYYCYSNVQYCPVEYAMAEDFRYYGQGNFMSWLEDSSCGTGGKWPYPVMNWQMYYVASKMCWDKTLDDKALLSETYDLYYGPAAPVMKRYHARRLELWDACPAHATMSNFSRPSYCLQPDGSKEELLGLLAEAEKAAKGNKDVLQRIAIDRDCLTDIWIKKNEKLRDALSKQKPLDVRRLTGKIVIDGELDDEGWKDAFVTDDFKRIIMDYSGKKHEPVDASVRTRVRCAYDDEAWYVAYEAMTDHTNTPLVVKTPADVRDAELWKEESVELFVMPPFDGYFHFIVNPNGALYDSEGQSGQDFDSKAEVKTKILADRFIVEMRIPAAPMRRAKIAAGDKWQIHFYRDDKRFVFTDYRGKSVKGEMSSLDGNISHVSTGFRRVDVK